MSYGPRVDIIWRDIGYALTAELASDEQSIDVTLCTQDGAPVLVGTIKIDGCGNLHTPSADGMKICGFDQIGFLHLALLRMWSVAREMLGENIPRRG